MQKSIQRDLTVYKRMTIKHLNKCDYSCHSLTFKKLLQKESQKLFLQTKSKKLLTSEDLDTVWAQLIKEGINTAETVGEEKVDLSITRG
jgi:hypothetical protein